MRWRPAWLVRWRARGHKFNFDLHRAGGLWLWPMLLVFAWSSVGFNLPSVYQPAMSSLGAAAPYERRALPTPLDDPPLSVADAIDTGERLLRVRAAREGFTVISPSAIVYYPAHGAYRYLARTSLDIMHEGGLTTIWIDGRDIGFEPATGPRAADTVNAWLGMLHMGLVGGTAYKILVSAVGLVTTMLSVTGVLIWMKKRSASLVVRRRRVTGLGTLEAPMHPAE